MILDNGTKVLLCHRRLFELDQPRYFTGRVDGYEDGLARVTGHTWIRASYDGTITRRGEVRTKIVSLSSGTVFIYQLPSSVNLDALRIDAEGTGHYLRDGLGFEMDLSEGSLSAKGARRSA